MVTIFTQLKSINAYPIPSAVIEGLTITRGLDMNNVATQEIMHSREYNLCRADLLKWLSLAPNISQGGQNYSFNEDQRKNFIKEAQSIYKKHSDEEVEKKVIYGYKGSRL